MTHRQNNQQTSSHVTCGGGCGTTLHLDTATRVAGFVLCVTCAATWNATCGWCGEGGELTRTEDGAFHASCL